MSSPGEQGCLVSHAVQAGEDLGIAEDVGRRLDAAQKQRILQAQAQSIEKTA